MSSNLFQSIGREIKWNNAIFCPEFPQNEMIISTILRLAESGNVEGKYILYLNKGLQKYTNINYGSIKYLENNSEKYNFLKLIDKLNFIIFHINQTNFSNFKSSIFIDSILLSIIPIVNKSTWMANELEKFGLDILIVDFNYVDLKERFNLINKNKLVISLKLNLMKNDYLKNLNLNTSSINSFLTEAAILNQKRAVHIFGQMQPLQKGLASLGTSPLYFTDVIFPKAVKSLGLEFKKVNAKHTGNLFHLIWLTLLALIKIKNNSNDLFIVWQGYGAYAIWISGLLGVKTQFILNTYKIPEGLNQSIWKVFSDKILRNLISKSEAVIVISRTQILRLNLFDCKRAAWIPFASDSEWWTPNIPDYAFLGNQGIKYQNFILIMGDADREENTSLRALSKLGHPIVRVTRDKYTAKTAQKAFIDEKVVHGQVCLNVSYELLRELYRGSRVVVVPANAELHPAGMTSLTEAMCCGKPVIIPSGMATDGYIKDGYNAFVLDAWEESQITAIAENIYKTEIGEYVGNNARGTVEELLNFNASASKLNKFLTGF